MKVKLHYGVPAGIRTPDRCLRRALLYPAELPGQVSTNKVNYTPLILFIQDLLLIFLQFLHYLPSKSLLLHYNYQTQNT